MKLITLTLIMIVVLGTLAIAGFVLAKDNEPTDTSKDVKDFSKDYEKLTGYKLNDTDITVKSKEKLKDKDKKETNIAIINYEFKNKASNDEDKKNKDEIVRITYQ